jgi:hypothetical protein
MYLIFILSSFPGHKESPENKFSGRTMQEKQLGILPMLFALSIFFHPDCTVGLGVSPNLPYGSRALPPVGNFTLP